MHGEIERDGVRERERDRERGRMGRRARQVQRLGKQGKVEVQKLRQSSRKERWTEIILRDLEKEMSAAVSV